MEKISRSVYPTEPITLEQWWKEFNIGRLANKSNHQAQEIMSQWKNRHGDVNTFESLIKTNKGYASNLSIG